MMQSSFTQETPFQVARLFGQNFAEQLFQLETNSWQGPIESGYGMHLVRIDEKKGAGMPELTSVIDKVRTDWMSEQRQKVNKEIYTGFKERYEIVVEEIPEKLSIESPPVPGGKSS
jgi:peptidyl-prolyl cis-trans isomerase C